MVQRNYPIQDLHFWEMDVRDLFKLWFAGFWTLTQVMMLFSMLALPVIIPGLLMWFYQYMTGTP
ncbi:MAG: hypothetical protein IPG42_18750 [Betaproteobacteria bacterium]|jgi:hypothetical protein|nr:hypothetical protein [Betaproteobacteria bacterium]MBP6647020.1 hypothetical protein [Burkholderiaceae bacterium]